MSTLKSARLRNGEVPPRQAAWEYLCALLKTQQALTLSFTPQDSPLTKALCFGVCRYFFELEAGLDRFVSKRPKAIEVWVLLLIGAYQLAHLQKPVYAVVNETVALLEGTRFSYAKGFVNGVLREWARQEALLTVQDEPSTQSPLAQLIQQDWPNEWPAILRANQAHAPMTLRVNLSLLTREAYVAHLSQQGIQATLHPYVPSAILLRVPCDVTALPGFQKGWVSVQDVAAQEVPSLLSLAKGLRVLDACAAPGGKTGHILEQEPALTECVALDVDERRLKRVQETMQRLGVTATLLQGDGCQPALWWGGEKFDRILVDAPCSGSGVVRRHPDIQLLRTAASIQQSATKQKQLLQALWPLLQWGGLLVYVTCSVLSQENDKVIAAFLADHPEVEHVPLTLPWGRQMKYGWQVLPGEAEGDGFYYAVLRNRMGLPRNANLGGKTK